MSERCDCPACGKNLTKKGVILHFYEALEGYDLVVWNKGTNPHIDWATSHLIPIDEGFIADSDRPKLKNVLKEYCQSRE